MLIDFYVGHFLSFDDIQRFSMRATDSSIGSKNCIAGKDILRSSFIFGPNAAGKSNLVDAFTFSKFIVLNGGLIGSNMKLENYLHRFEDGTSSKDPAYFEYVVEIDGKKLQYGVEVGEFEQITSEWLYIFDETDSPKEIFVIDHSNLEKSRDSIVPELTGMYSDYLQELADGDNMTFLYESSKGFDLSKQLITWFDSYLIINSFDKPDIIMIAKHGYLNELKDALADIDSNIIGFEISSEPTYPTDANMGRLNEVTNWLIYDEAMKKYHEKNPNDWIIGYIGNNLYISKPNNKLNEVYNLLIKHQKQNSKGFFKMISRLESEGICRYIAIHLALYGDRCFVKSMSADDQIRLNTEKTVIIDEIECSLHPIIIVKMISDLLNNEESSDIQLIATTHEMMFLRKEEKLDCIKRDAIWLVDRDYDKKSNPTVIYSLLEYPEIDKKNWRKIYLDGKVGAIPNVSLNFEKEDSE